jgi:hypothetical protein
MSQGNGSKRFGGLFPQMRGNQQTIRDEPHIIADFELTDLRRLLKKVQNPPRQYVQEENNRNSRPEFATLLRYEQRHRQSNEEDVGNGKPGIIEPTSTKNLGVVSQKYVPADSETSEARSVPISRQKV